MARAALVLAAVSVGITVGVAWALALAAPVAGPVTGPVERTTAVRPRESARGEGTGWVTVRRFDGWGAWFAESYVQPAEGEGSGPEAASPGAPEPEGLVPRWAIRALLPRTAKAWPDSESTWAEMIDVRGWPMGALWCGYTYEVNEKFRVYAAVRGGVEVPRMRRKKGAWSGDYPAALPLRPVWAGLVVNSVLTAGALAAVVHVPGAVRRRLRRRAGACPVCGYDVRATAAGRPCPECGAGNIGGMVSRRTVDSAFGGSWVSDTGSRGCGRRSEDPRE